MVRVAGAVERPEGRPVRDADPPERTDAPLPLSVCRS